MKRGDLVRRSTDTNFGGDMFSSWRFNPGNLPVHVGCFSPDSIGIVLDVIDGRAKENMCDHYYAIGIRVIVDNVVGWINSSSLEKIQ